MRGSLVLLALAAGSAVSLGAQVVPPPLAPGVRVRVVAPASDGHSRPEMVLQGAFVRASGDTIFLREGPYQQGAVLEGRRSLEVRAGRHRQWVRGALVGVAAGTVIFGVPAAVASAGGDGPGLFIVLYASAAGGAIGLLTGTLVGGLSVREEWVPVRQPDVRVAVGPGSLGLSIAF